MKTTTFNIHSFSFCIRYKPLVFRLLGALALYICFGVLASTVYAADRIPEPLNATHGSVWLQNSNGDIFNALLLHTDVDYEVSGMIARATVKQQFKNTSSLWAEGGEVIFSIGMLHNMALMVLQAMCSQNHQSQNQKPFTGTTVLVVSLPLTHKWSPRIF